MCWGLKHPICWPEDSQTELCSPVACWRRPCAQSGLAATGRHFRGHTKNRDTLHWESGKHISSRCPSVRSFKKIRNKSGRRIPRRRNQVCKERRRSEQEFWEPHAAVLHLCMLWGGVGDRPVAGSGDKPWRARQKRLNFISKSDSCLKKTKKILLEGIKILEGEGRRQRVNAII